jgi:hypothetical protein
VTTEWGPPRRSVRASSEGGATRTRVTWGCGGLLLGVLLSTLVLIVFAPHPKVVTMSPAAPSHITVTVDDQYLTRLVVQGINSANLPGFTVTNVKAHIAADNVLTFSGTVAAGLGISIADLTAQGQLGASGGLLVVSNIAGNLGGLVLPTAVASGLEIGINYAITQERQRLTQGGISYFINGVSTTDGRLTLTLNFS